ncbi:MAG: CBS domain-containing protein [Piscirickettsiaceae bacterium]|nr:CBS domain-containing protein [Piscirickettsiaceae bacterium]
MIEKDFSSISVNDWMTTHSETAVVVSVTATMEDIAQVLLENNSRDAYVVDNNIVVGHLGFANVTNHLLTEHRPTHTHRQLFSRVTEPTAAEVMDSRFAYARCDESLCEVIHRQLERDVETLVVLAENGSLLGAIELRDLLAESLK